MSLPNRHRLDVSADALPVLPLRDTVLYPNMVAPILVGQERSLRLIEDAMHGSRLVVMIAQRSAERQPAQPDDLYHVGTMAMVHEATHLQERALRTAVQGVERVRLVDWVKTEPYLVGRVEPRPDIEDRGVQLDALARTATQLFAELVSLAPELSDELATVARATTSEPRQLAYLIASSAPLATTVRQELLELDPVSAKLQREVELLQHETAVRRVMQKITTETTVEMSRAQRDHILRKQMESIQRELGVMDPERAESRELRDRFAALPLPEEARKEVDRELDRLERTPAASPEHGMLRTYLDWMLKLPWGKITGGRIDVKRTRTVLDEDHHDLDKIKQRIVEYLAVKQLRQQRALEQPPDAVEREPILCFVGPPGVGKTSLAHSIARAIGRKLARVSLGGIHDEAEIRGHRRTYVGAMPGRVLQAIARADASDPVFVLDEVDKLGVGFHGDPSAALLEVLDPAQNHSFVDTYLGVSFDLSRVLFICTANTTESIPPALIDRMEVLHLAGYTESEKLQIARRHVLPKALAAHGLRRHEVIIDEDAIRRVIREYTREAGVRTLERELSGILRKVALAVGEGILPPIVVNASTISDYLGSPKFFDEVAERIDRPGVATGLAWTPSGGDILFVEATIMPGDEERLLLTGMLGNVMRESAQAALSYLRSNAERLEIDPRVFPRSVVHVHVPAGAIPKDGPSAGATILTALASRLTCRLVRNDIAMTGEITLRGKVLPVGGIKEKILAAHRAGIHTIVLPRQNESALEDVPEEIRRACEIVLVESVDEVLSVALSPARAMAKSA